ncbi:MAG: hypothetical protein B1H03_06710 [Planctomycetales bacterium 4484_113]|nr:MAG: hypothetical protein B1H03_06710 [Planctomycetales bacterium 4484_113]
MELADGANPGLEQRLQVALHFKSRLNTLTKLVFHRTRQLANISSSEEGRRLAHDLLAAALKSIAEGELAYYLQSLIRLVGRNLKLELRIDEISRLGEEVFLALEDDLATNSAPPSARDIVEQHYTKFKSDEVRVKLFQDYVHLQEDILFRQVEELSLLASVSELTQEDFLKDTALPDQLISRLMSILQADDAVAFFHSQYFRVIFTRLRGQEDARWPPPKLRELVARGRGSSFDPDVERRFSQLLDEGYSWAAGHREREVLELLESFYPGFHEHPPRALVQRILDFDIDNPLLKVCLVHSYMTYDLFVDADNYGLIFVNRSYPPDFTEEDHRFFVTFGGQLKQIVGNIILTQRLQEMATTDALTGVYNRRQFESFMESELARASRYNQSVGLAMIDLDHFKEINDTLGHQAGDHILAELCRVLQEGLRVTEIISRYGGEEFAVIIPQADFEVVRVVGEKIRSLVEEHRFVYAGKEVPLTVSVGLAVFPQMAIDQQSLIEAADRALYRAKREGRNQVCFPVELGKEAGR